MFYWYSPDYMFEDHSDFYKEVPITVTTLRNLHDISGATPDAPTISVVEVPNPDNIPLEKWVTSSRISNFYLSRDKKLATSTIGKEPALSYTHAGYHQYDIETDAVAHGNNIFLFSVDLVSPPGKLYSDFKNLLGTVLFK